MLIADIGGNCRRRSAFVVQAARPQSDITNMTTIQCQLIQYFFVSNCKFSEVSCTVRGEEGRGVSFGTVACFKNNQTIKYKFRRFRAHSAADPLFSYKTI